MARIVSFDIMQADLPFRKPFRHAAAGRSVSNSLFLKCTTDTRVAGFGESLPRAYVTGETADAAFVLLRERILPRLRDKAFQSFAAVKRFLETCDGKAPAEWVAPGVPQCAAWCAVDLALLDTFGRVFNESVCPSIRRRPRVRYSGVLSDETRGAMIRSCLLFRLLGFRYVKPKVGHDCESTAATARRWLGRRIEIRADANMAWARTEAAQAMKTMSRLGIRSFEQPLAADALDASAELVRQTGLEVMADEGFTDRQSLMRLIDRQACTAVNVRISKCGGFVAAARRCREARGAGLTLQVGCQVGESSLLSAAQLALLARVPDVTFAEGCFGRYLLQEDPVTPPLQFGYGGRPPRQPVGPGLGVRVDEERLQRWVTRRATV
jgi:muconate cycloisomerase